ncbi:hypothetical protein JCGZ_20160 [Jatropha curcas]|uniref:Uncharacterized protein n=1 Tax=Jatropha curcas TaxID=180498 RepID=A0A067LL47_JATCU|nr:hypothetical protein JCGZ_20160 [Jatropha curcas]
MAASPTLSLTRRMEQERCPPSPLRLRLSHKAVTPEVPDLTSMRNQRVRYITQFGMASYMLLEEVQDYWPVYLEGMLHPLGWCEEMTILVAQLHGALSEALTCEGFLEL